jgi:hypothetical protein
MTPPAAQFRKDERAPRPGECCQCGRPATVVYVTERFGDVAYCGIPDGGRRPDGPPLEQDRQLEAEL